MALTRHVACQATQCLLSVVFWLKNLCLQLTVHLSGYSAMVTVMRQLDLPRKHNLHLYCIINSIGSICCQLFSQASAHAVITFLPADPFSCVIFWAVNFFFRKLCSRYRNHVPSAASMVNLC